MSKKIILGCCSTGAKYTPLNHRHTGEYILDRICSGTDIAVSMEEIAAEIRSLDALGCRYYHYHARNPETREQTTDRAIYAEVGRIAQAMAPSTLVSFGASRNGPEVMQRIAQRGEWERIGHAALPLGQGGAHFITLQAAIELQIICDLEKGYRPLTMTNSNSDDFLEAIARYRPSSRMEEMRMETNSTANGNNYGASSPEVQMEAYAQAIAARRHLHLLDEVEWVQLVRSYAMTRMAIHHPALRLADAGQLNITILFGFSPKLPFPGSYGEFRSVVHLAKSLERDTPSGPRMRRVSVTVGSAVLPHHAAALVRPMDVGPLSGLPLDPMRRLVAYAAQGDSEVDVVRVGMEDTPFLLGEAGRLNPTNNVALCEAAADILGRCGAQLRNDPSCITERRAPLLKLAA